ncbi:hypothetical protein [Streptomyces sp. NPDC051000]|uniref:hypothetical protein n=1 Tax=Streptomyces sp. NPDC051000 TaxID=3155520 RepID=UPI0033DCD294
MRNPRRRFDGNHRGGRRRAVTRAGLVTLAGTGLLVTMAAAPAAAARPESGWVNGGGGARTNSAPSVLNTGGIEYTAILGLDNRVWVAYNGNAFRQIPTGHETRHAPAIVTIAGRIAVFHTGTDGATYYTLLQNLENNSWSGWTRIPGNVVSVAPPSVSVLRRNVAAITVSASNGTLAVQRMEIQPGGTTYRTNYQELSGFRIPTDLPRGEAVVSWTWFNRVGNREMYMNVAAVGMDHHVWQGAYNVDNPSETLAPSQVPGGGVCESGIAAARGGPPDRVAAPGDSDYHSMSHQALACIGTDGNTWVNQTSNAGATYDGWNRTTDGAGPSNSQPSLAGAGNTLNLSIRWNGNANPRFPDNAVVEKSLF